MNGTLANSSVILNIDFEENTNWACFASRPLFFLSAMFIFATIFIYSIAGCLSNFNKPLDKIDLPLLIKRFHPSGLVGLFCSIFIAFSFVVTCDNEPELMDHKSQPIAIILSFTLLKCICCALLLKPFSPWKSMSIFEKLKLIGSVIILVVQFTLCIYQILVDFHRYTRIPEGSYLYVYSNAGIIFLGSPIVQVVINVRIFYIVKCRMDFTFVEYPFHIINDEEDIDIEMTENNCGIIRSSTTDLNALRERRESVRRRTVSCVELLSHTCVPSSHPDSLESETDHNTIVRNDIDPFYVNFIIMKDQGKWPWNDILTKAGSYRSQPDIAGRFDEMIDRLSGFLLRLLCCFSYAFFVTHGILAIIIFFPIFAPAAIFLYVPYFMYAANILQQTEFRRQVEFKSKYLKSSHQYAIKYGKYIHQKHPRLVRWSWIFIIGVTMFWFSYFPIRSFKTMSYFYFNIHSNASCDWKEAISKGFEEWTTEEYFAEMNMDISEWHAFEMNFISCFLM